MFNGEAEFIEKLFCLMNGIASFRRFIVIIKSLLLNFSPRHLEKENKK